MKDPEPECYWCGHPHLFRDACTARIPAPEWDPPSYPCRCTQGTSRKSVVIARPRKRLAIPKAVRDAVVLRDGLVCTLCGCDVYMGRQEGQPVGRRLTFDHILHYSAGGPDTVANLRVACMSCNSRRGARDRTAGVTRG